MKCIHSVTNFASILSSLSMKIIINSIIVNFFRTRLVFNKVSNLNFLDFGFDGFLVFKIPMCHDSATKFLFDFINIEKQYKRKNPANRSICRVYRSFWPFLKTFKIFFSFVFGPSRRKRELFSDFNALICRILIF